MDCDARDRDNSCSRQQSQMTSLSSLLEAAIDSDESNQARQKLVQKQKIHESEK